jgi:hypothetical protein
MKTLTLILSLLLAVPAFAQFPSTGGELASNRAIVLDVSGMGTASVSVGGTYSGTINFEVGNGLTPVSVDCTPPNDPATPVNSTTSTGTWICSVAGLNQFVVRMSGYVSGTAVVRLSAAPGSGGAASGATVSGTVNIGYSSRADTFTGTGNGTAVDVSTGPRQWFGIQVKGTGAAATSWTVNLQASLDGTNYSTILTHANTTDTDGSIAWISTPAPALYFRSNVSAVALGSATNIVVTIVGMP